MANSFEKIFIKYNKTDCEEYGYNGTSGGKDGALNKNSRKKQQESYKGYKFTEERKRELSKMFSGVDNPMYGKTGILAPSSRQVICLNDMKIYDTLKEAGEYNNVKPRNVGNVCQGTYNQILGYVFMYLDDYNIAPKEFIEEKKKYIGIKPPKSKYKIYCKELNLTFYSINKASEYFKISYSNMRNCIKLGNKVFNKYTLQVLTTE